MRRLVMVLFALLAVAAPAAAAPAAAGPDATAPARAVLAISQDRLSLMQSVAAYKWVHGLAVEDLAQEQTVLDGARAAAAERGLDPEAVAGVFAQEIDAAKVVQNGWQGAWRAYGFPAVEPVPASLADVRTALSSISARIVDQLARLGPIACRPHVRGRLLRSAQRLMTARFVTDRVRLGLIDATLRAAPPCRS